MRGLGCGILFLWRGRLGVRGVPALYARFFMFPRCSEGVWVGAGWWVGA